MMAWLILIVAGLFETAWAIGLKSITTWTDWKPIGFTIITMILSVVLLGYAMKFIPIGTAYAIWTGIGTIGVVIFGVIFFGESSHWPRLLSICLVVTGIVGLKFFE